MPLPFVPNSVGLLARTIRQRRMLLGLSQETLATRMSPSTCSHDIRQLESGKGAYRAGPDSSVWHAPSNSP
jgi:ribosome-binding protein aMBF1 (putative translation factor)